MADHHPPHTETPHGMSPATRMFIFAVIVADLFAVVYFGGTFLLTGSLMGHKEETKIVVAGAEEATTSAGPAEEAKPAFDLASYVADPVKGASVSAKCKACHTFDAGGPSRTGPNLFGIVGAALGHSGSFAYSDKLLAKKAEWPTWTEEELHAFLENPKATIPGTKMTYNGVKDPKERADLIAYLKTLK